MKTVRQIIEEVYQQVTGPGRLPGGFIGIYKNALIQELDREGMASLTAACPKCGMSWRHASDCPDHK